MESFLGALAGFLFIFLILALAIYIVIGIFLNKFNKLVYGKGTAMAWIPGFNVYLLGKLTVNKIVGWILVACMFLTSSFSITSNDIQTAEGVTVTVNGVEQTKTLLPKEISTTLSVFYFLAVIGLLIFAIIKYNKLKKAGTDTTQQVQQTAQPAMNGQPLTSQEQQTTNQN